MPAAIADPTFSDQRIDDPRSVSPAAVLVYAKDPISRAGVSSQLAGAAGIEVIGPGQGRVADIAVVVADVVDDEALRVIRTIRRAGSTQVVVVAELLDTVAMLAAAEAGAIGFLRRTLADRGRLVHVVTAARHGKTSLSERLHGHPLPGEMGADDRAPLSSPAAHNLSARDLEVLRLLADGCDTAAIAQRLAYSEPTIKNVIQRLFENLKARNRPHAVAVALRAGII